ncbi:MAG: sulfatase-like hydrolase/transferase [Phycisphaerae bacterium]
MAVRSPNILLITTDQQRYDALGINGNRVLRTPNLDHLAAAGTNFSRCYVTCPVCIPARRTLISGLSPQSHGLRRYRDGVPFEPPATLPGVLSAAGYQTQLVGKLHLHPQRKRFGFDHMVLSDSASWRPTSAIQNQNDYTAWLASRGLPSHSTAHGVNGNGRVARPWHLDEVYHQTSWLARRAVDFFDGWRDPSSPWFMHLSFTAPPPPLVPPRDYYERYIHRTDLAPTLGEWAPAEDGRRGLDPVAPVGPFPPDEIHDAIAGYYGLINHIDDCVQYVIDRYFEYHNPRGREPLYILFTSDHGEMLGDHHLFRKSLGYEASAHVPLFIAGRNVDVPQGTSDALVSWEDVMPTVLDLAGVPVPDGLDGHSLVPVMRGQSPAVRQTVFGGCGGSHDNHWLVHGRHKYIWYARTGEEQLFDLATDPNECHDLSADAAMLEEPRRQMAQHLSHLPDVDYAPANRHPCGNRPPRVFWP